MRFCVLGSGSRGNALAIWSDERGILIDAGLRYKELSRRLHEKEIDPRWLKAVLLTHAHGDHTQGLRLWCQNQFSPIYATLPTFQALASPMADWLPMPHKCAAGSPCWRCDLSDFLEGHPKIHVPIPHWWDHGERKPVAFEVEGFSVMAWPCVHNAPCPVTFTISQNGSKLAMITETGQATKEILADAQDADALLLESNHEPGMLATNENLPDFLIDRIAVTHLSNLKAARILRGIGPRTKYVSLLHLSRDNNHPDLARAKALEALNEGNRMDVQLDVASQDRPGEVIEL